jgi:hypothetical protein
MLLLCKEEMIEKKSSVKNKYRAIFGENAVVILETPVIVKYAKSITMHDAE